MTTLDSIAEARPGPRWARIYAQLWPGYRAWYIRDDVAARPSFLESRRMLRQHMPQLYPTWEALVDLAGGGDLQARFLAMWRPPPYIRGCCQVVWPSDPPVLARNYDYSPLLWDAVLWRTEWTGPAVLAMTDSLWGVLDGINEAGLCVSLAFGGRRIVGAGFGMPLILRYVLEICETTAQAGEVLARVPTHMAYNVTVLDAKGRFATVHTAPDRTAEITHERAVTNHQPLLDWSRYVEATHSEARLRELWQALADEGDDDRGEDEIEARLLREPLHRRAAERMMETLYTAIYRPQARSVRLAWPGLRLEQGLEAFREGTLELPSSSSPPE